MTIGEPKHKMTKGGPALEAQRKKIIIIAAAAAAIFGMSFYSFWEKNTVPDTVAFNPPGAQQVNAAQSKSAEVAVIYISGAVNKPGVYKLSSQLRVVDAINSAGGLATGADVTRVNLAQQVKDGMHVYVPLAGDKSQSASVVQASDKVNINTADKSALEKLPGIGPSLAEKILDYRKSNGGFNDVNDIKKVSGIGDAKFSQIKDKITL